MRYASLVLGVLSGVLMVACSGSDGDTRYIDKAPPTTDTSHGLAPKTDKKMPAMGGPSTMGGPSAGPAAGPGMASSPAERPAGTK